MTLVAPTLDGLQAAPGAAPGPASVPAASPASFGAGIGAAAGAVGDAVASVDLEKQKAAAAAKRRVEQASLFDATTQLQKAANESWSGFRQTRGRASGEQLDANIAGLNERGTAIEASLPPELRPVFAANRTRYVNEYATRANDHANEQLHAYAADSFSEHVSTVTDAAALDAQDGTVRYAALPPGRGQSESAWSNRKLLDAKWADIEEADNAYAEANQDTLGKPMLEWLDERLRKDRAQFDAGIVSGFLAGHDGQPGDPASAGAWMREHGHSLDPAVREKLTGDVERATDVVDTSRLVGSIFAAHAGDAGPWSKREDAMLADAGYAREGIRSDVSKALKAAVSSAREADTQRAGDQTLGLLDALSKGASPAAIAEAAQSLPVNHRDAVLTAIGNGAKGIVAQQQGDFYQEWATKAAGFDPATGKPDPAMRAEFLAHDFVPDITSAARGDWDHLRALQNEGKSGGGKATDSLVSDDEIAQHVVNVIAPDLKDTKRAERLYDTKRKLGNLWAAERGDGPELSPTKKQAQADELIAASVFDRSGIGGPTGGNLSVLEALTSDPASLDVGDIPDDQRMAAEEALSRAGISDPSHAQIAAQYLNTIRDGLLNGVR